MEPIEVTTREYYVYAMLINVGLGVLIGLVPLITGFVKQQKKPAFLGFVLTIFGSALLGLLLAIPIAAIFTWLVFTGAAKAASGPADNPPSS